MKKVLFPTLILVLAASLTLPMATPTATAADPTNLVTNGGFEEPVVTNQAKWDIFPSGTPQLGWAAEWYDGSSSYLGHTRPAVANLELHRGVNGWLPAEGQQYTELDSDWDGPGGTLNNEPASLRIYQDIVTVSGGDYELSFAFSPRPGEAENQLEVKWGGAVVDTLSASGIGLSNTKWTVHTYPVTATGATTRLEFTDLSTPNSLGTFLDDVSVTIKSLPGGSCVPYCVFGNQGVNIGPSSKVKLGSVGSNSDVSTGNGSSIDGNVDSGGNVALGATNDIGGNVTATGNVGTGNGSNINGNVDSGGNVALGATNDVGGNVTATGNVGTGNGSSSDGNVNSGGNVTLGATNNVGDDITAVGDVSTGNGTHLLPAGDINSGGDVSLGASNNVGGNITAFGTITKGSGTTIGGTETPSSGIIPTPASPVAPTAYSPITLPPTTVFGSGGPDVIKGGSQTTTLPPGSYGTLQLGTINTLNLSTGDYYFDSFSMGGSSKLNLDVSGGPIRIFVTGNMTFGTSLQTTVTGGGAEDINVETHGNFSLGGSGKWFGFIFAPMGNIDVSSSAHLTGAFWAAGIVTTSNDVVFNCIECSAEQGSITIVKDAIPDDEQDFHFSGDLGEFILDDDGGADNTYTNSATFYNLQAGNYDVTESVPAGWSLSIDGAPQTDSTANISLGPSENVTITFTNTKQLCTISGYKYRCNNSDNCTQEGLENWTITLDGPISDNTTTDENGYYEFTNLPDGTYTISETLKDGWVNCTPTSYQLTLDQNCQIHGQGVIVSDTNTVVTQGNGATPHNAVYAWEPGPNYPNDGPDDSSWAANSKWDQGINYNFSGSGADWIWESYRVVHPVAGDVVTFQRNFYIPSNPTSGTLHITCDNGYEVYLNGNLIGSAQLHPGWGPVHLTQTYVDTNGWQSVENYPGLSLVQGNNLLEIKTANEYMGPDDGQNDGTISSNPAGLIYELLYEFDATEINFCNREAVCCTATAPDFSICTGTTVDDNLFLAHSSCSEGCTPSFTHNIDNQTPGTYEYTITCSNGICPDASDSGTVTVNPLPTVDAGDNLTVCQYADLIDLNNTGESPSGGTWSGTGVSDSQFDPDDLPPGAYSIMYSYADPETGCSNSDNKTVTINPLPDCTITAPTSVCANSTVNIASVPDAGDNVTYEWEINNGTITGGQDTDSITWDAGNIDPVTIGITITNANGCSCSNQGVDIIVNPLPIATASSNSPVCIGGTIQLTGGSDNMTSYRWVGPNGFISDQQSPSIPNANFLMVGTYYLSVTDHNCTSDNATVSVNVVPCIPAGGGGPSEVGFGQTAPQGATCPLTLTVNILGQIATARMTPDGVLCEDCLAYDPSRQNSWEAKSGTKLTLVDNQIPRLIKVTLATTSPSSSPAETIGQTYEINAYPSLSATNPVAISISPLFTMSSDYDPDKLPTGTSEVVFAYYPNSNQGWLPMGPVAAVAALGEAQGTLNFFAPDTLLAKLAHTKAAEFGVSNLTIDPTKARPNQQVAISIDVINTGGSSGDHTVQLKVNGTTMDTKNVTLAAGESRTVSFVTTSETSGRYQVEIAGLNGEFVIAPGGFNWWPIVGIIVAIILALGIWILIRWRRFSGY
jgi:hypothetical protein